MSANDIFEDGFREITDECMKMTNVKCPHVRIFVSTALTKNTDKFFKNATKLTKIKHNCDIVTLRHFTHIVHATMLQIPHKNV